jgi:hypothetical protein
MTAVAATGVVLAEASVRLAETLVRWLETGDRPDDLFAEGLFLDLSLPQWRLQEASADRAFGIREGEHPYPGRVRVEGLDQTARGFLLQFEERWEAEGQEWYCREMMHCVVADGRISELIVYCTGDWDAEVQRRHAGQVRLFRP